MYQVSHLDLFTTRVLDYVLQIADEDRNHIWLHAYVEFDRGTLILSIL